MSDSPKLLVAASVDRVLNKDSVVIGARNPERLVVIGARNPERLELGDNLTKMSDAEEAIKKARRQERQKILDKITEACYGEISKLKSQIKEEDGKGTQSVADLRQLEKRFDKKFEELRDDLQQEDGDNKE